MKKLLACTFALVMTFFLLTACGNPGGSTPGSAPPDSKPSENVASADKEYILVGRVVPLTGSIAAFGAGTPYIEEQAVAEINAAGGIYIEEYGKKLPIKFVIADSESSATKASEAATKLILEDKIDIMIVSHTADTVLPVSAVCERYGVPCISVDCPADMWADGGPYEYCYHAFFNTETELLAFADAWNIVETNKKVGLLCATDTEGTIFRESVSALGNQIEGYTIIDPGQYTIGSNDFTKIIQKFVEEDVEIICGPIITPDFATFYRQCLAMNYVPKIFAIDKANLYRADVISYGDNIGHGLLSEVWWDPSMDTVSSLTGQTSQELGSMYLEYNPGIVLPPSPIGYKHANVELLVDALQRAQSLEPGKFLAAVAKTDLDTIVGHIQFDENHVCVMNMVVGQWSVDSSDNWSLNIVANKYLPEIPKSGTAFAMPSSGD